MHQVTNDPLQRVYGVSFPSKDQMKKFQEFQEQVQCRVVNMQSFWISCTCDAILVFVGLLLLRWWWWWCGLGCHCRCSVSWFCFLMMRRNPAWCTKLSAPLYFFYFVSVVTKKNTFGALTHFSITISQSFLVVSPNRAKPPFPPVFGLKPGQEERPPEGRRPAGTFLLPPPVPWLGVLPPSRHQDL